MHYQWQFRAFFSNSSVFRLRACTVFRLANDVDHFRLGITLKARGSSVERNRLKRQVRESMRKLAPHLGSFDYNVVIPGGKPMSYLFSKQISVCLADEFKRKLLLGQHIPSRTPAPEREVKK
ncbi:ribonuclease P protein component [Bdellovibrionota bacterium FG-2]